MSTPVLPPPAPRPTLPVPRPRPLDELRREAAERLAEPCLPAEALLLAWREEEAP